MVPAPCQEQLHNVEDRCHMLKWSSYVGNSWHFVANKRSSVQAEFYILNKKERGKILFFKKRADA